jgi:hypothetical protein
VAVGAAFLAQPLAHLLQLLLGPLTLTHCNERAAEDRQQSGGVSLS